MVSPRLPSLYHSADVPPIQVDDHPRRRRQLEDGELRFRRRVDEELAALLLHRRHLHRRRGGAGPGSGRDQHRGDEHSGGHPFVPPNRGAHHWSPFATPRCSPSWSALKSFSSSRVTGTVNFTFCGYTRPVEWSVMVSVITTSSRWIPVTLPPFCPMKSPSRTGQPRCSGSSTAPRGRAVRATGIATRSCTSEHFSR